MYTVAMTNSTGVQSVGNMLRKKPCPLNMSVEYEALKVTVEVVESINIYNMDLTIRLQF